MEKKRNKIQTVILKTDSLKINCEKTILLIVSCIFCLFF